HLLEAGAQPGGRVLLHGGLRLPLREERRDVLGGVPEPRHRRQRQDQPCGARGAVPELVHRAELGPGLLLAAHADAHVGLSGPCESRRSPCSSPPRGPRGRTRRSSSTTAAGSRATAPSSTTWSGGSGTRAGTRSAT